MLSFFLTLYPFLEFFCVTDVGGSLIFILKMARKVIDNDVIMIKLNN